MGTRIARINAASEIYMQQVRTGRCQHACLTFSEQCSCEAAVNGIYRCR